VDYIETVTGMMTDELVPMSQEWDSSDGMATKQFLITSILYDWQITAIWWNTGSPASQNLAHLRMGVDIF